MDRQLTFELEVELVRVVESENLAMGRLVISKYDEGGRKNKHRQLAVAKTGCLHLTVFVTTGH